MKRLLSLFAMAALLGAGCAPAPAPEAPVPAPAPSIPVQVSEPEYAKDWLTYASRQFGFTFKYPKHIIPTDLQPREIPLGTAVENYGSKNVPVRWLKVLLLRSDDPGLKEHYYSANGWTEGEELAGAETQTIGGLTWYVLKESDAAAGNRYTTHSYVTTIGYTHVVLLFQVHSVACQNYGEDWQEKCVEFDEARDAALFRQIVETYKPKPE